MDEVSVLKTNYVKVMEMKFKIRDLNKGTFKIKYLLLILIVIYLPIAINGFVMYKRAIKIETKDRLMIVWHMMDKSVDNMNKEIDSIVRAVDELGNHNGIERGVQVYNEQLGENRKAISEFLDSRMKGLISDQAYLEEVVIVSVNGEKFQSNIETNFDYNKLTSYLKENPQLELQHEPIFISSTEKQVFFDGKEYFMLVQPIKNIDGKRVVGHLIATINIQKLLSNYALLDPGYNAKTGMYIKTNGLLMGDELSGISLEEIEKNIDKANPFEVKKTEGYISKTHIQGIQIPNTPLYFISVVNENDLLDSIKKALQNNYLLLLHITMTTSFVLIVLFIFSANNLAEKNNAQYRYAVSEELNQKLRIYKHDFMNHLQVVQALIELDYKDRAIDYIRKLATEGSTAKCKCDVGIPEIESTIHSNLMSIKDRQFDVDLSCINLSENFKYDTYDIVNIISNLLRNAVQAITEVEEDNKKISLNIYKDSTHYYFDVKNTHPLIDQDLRDKVFEKGYSTKNEAGRGLGLFITKRIVHKYNGEISLNVDESGNTFSVKLPI